MALTPCPDCQTPISTDAYACPKCGRPTGKRPPYAPSFKRFVVLWLVLIVTFLVIWQYLGDGAPRH